MKIIAQIRVDLHSTKRDVLARIYSEGKAREYGFDVWLPQQDPRVGQILSALQQVGYSQWNGRGYSDPSCEYMLNLVREYEPSDFNEIEYLEFWPEPVDSIGHEMRDEHGCLRLERPTLKNARRTGWDFASTILGNILVLQSVRDILQEASFAHLLFRPTTLIAGRGTRPGRHTPIPWEQFNVTLPWWELTSDLILPPLSPSMDLRDGKGSPIQPGDCSKGCVARDGFYNHAELHYRRSDLAEIQPFDVARTFECFGVRGHTETRRTIVSKRFYDYWCERGFKGRWAPVRIDD